jgi:hypothetical protein
MYVLNLFSVVNENPFILHLIKCYNKHQKLPYTLDVILMRNVILYRTERI